MKLKLCLVLCLTLSLSARENPFVPLNDGTLASENRSVLDVKKALDVFEKVEIPQKKTVIKKVEKPKVTLKNKPIKPVVKKVKKKKKRTYKKPKKDLILYHSKYTKISHRTNQLKITTQDTMLKNFQLKSPNRIVFDFERFDVIKPLRKKVNSTLISNIRVGHHDYFYRVTLTLKKYKSYKLKKIADGYIISFF
ncbi:MAG: AMIN domain-containing protein [Epsilonproteobacteria bacterium]|nr:AMIN domain-containing protein [Campylobacterota bacterium]